MAKNNEKNPILQQVEDNLECFIENINCIHDSYSYCEKELNVQSVKAANSFSDFAAKKLVLNEENGEYEIPLKLLRAYNMFEKKKKQTERALSLIPPSFVVTLVSTYDSFYAGLVRCVYALNPKKLQESQIHYTYSQLLEYADIHDVKNDIISTTIDSLLRDSHVRQIEWLEKAFGVDTLKKFDGWIDFVEITERRNLFVHSDGIVSDQYIKVCKQYGVSIKGIELGNKLGVDKDYVDLTYRVLYRMGIMLTQMLLNTLYILDDNKDTESLDAILINYVYELISSGSYSEAIILSKFALGDKFKHTGKDRKFIILNMAQAYKWNNDQEQCLKTLSEIDNTDCSDEFMIPKLTLEENFEEVYVRMRKILRNSDFLTPVNYRDWPIFKKLRKEPMFQNVFKEVFDEELIGDNPIKIENVEKPTDAPTTMTEAPTRTTTNEG